MFKVKTSMKKSALCSGLFLLLGASCEPSQVGSEQSTVREPIKVCTRSDGTCTDSNCDDINQPYQGSGSDFSMKEPNTLSYRYKLTGFYRNATGSWLVRGYHVKQTPLSPTHVPADGTVTGLTVGGVSQKLVNFDAQNGNVKLTYCTPGAAGCGAGVNVVATGTSLLGVQIKLQVPYAPGLTAGGFIDYTLQFDSIPQVLNLVSPSSVDVRGFKFSYFYTGLAPQSLCQGPLGVSQRTFFYQDSYWHPETFLRTQEASAITVTCELGAIAACMSWGYRPWDTRSFNSNTVSLRSWHAACVNMKTANYCGDGVAWTRYGTSIYVNDPLSPQVMGGSLARLEAFWDENGALCVNDGNRRVASLPWSTSSCYTNIPSCDTLGSSAASSFLGSAIP
jgi:hypothetical protein